MGLRFFWEHQEENLPPCVLQPVEAATHIPRIVAPSSSHSSLLLLCDISYCACVLLFLSKEDPRDG